MILVGSAQLRRSIRAAIRDPKSQLPFWVGREDVVDDEVSVPGGGLGDDPDARIIGEVPAAALISLCRAGVYAGSRSWSKDLEQGLIRADASWVLRVTLTDPRSDASPTGWASGGLEPTGPGSWRLRQILTL